MTFKELYANIKKHLQDCTKGKTLVFTHRGFYGYEFKVTASKVKENEQRNN